MICNLTVFSCNNKLGRPGIPGSNDLKSALRRLSLRRANELNEMDFKREEKERQARERYFKPVASIYVLYRNI